MRLAQKGRGSKGLGYWTGNFGGGVSEGQGRARGVGSEGPWAGCVQLGELLLIEQHDASLKKIAIVHSLEYRISYLIGNITSS